MLLDKFANILPKQAVCVGVLYNTINYQLQRHVLKKIEIIFTCNYFKLKWNNSMLQMKHGMKSS